MKTNSLILLTLLLAITISQVSSQADNRVYCDPKPADFDPTQVICTLEYNPVCGYSNSSNSEGSTGSNPCFACAQVGVDYYVEGACPGDNNGEETENGEGGNNEEDNLIVYCQLPDLSATHIACTLQYDPVCAYNFGDNSGKTLGNACEACYQNGYDYYTKGECDEENPGEGETGEGDNGETGDNIIQCPVLNLTATDVVCTLQYEPVCAYHENDTNLENGVTVGNACEACQQQGFSFYQNGVCQGDSGPGEEIILNEELYPHGGVAVVCEIPDLSATDILCLDIYEPVCGYFFNDTNEANGVTVPNACQACLQQGYEYYVQGACPNDSSAGGVEESQELDSGVTRCAIPDQSATDIICTEQFEPVCAFSDNNPDSGTTVGNACQACLQKGYDYYVNGACEGQA